MTGPKWSQNSALGPLGSVEVTKSHQPNRLSLPSKRRKTFIILRRKVRGRARLRNNDRWFLIQLYRWFPSILQVVAIVQPQTLVRWHRAGFRRYWRRKSRSLGGRPQIETDLRALIRRMSIENPLWGAPCIHCLLYTSPSPRDRQKSRMPSSA